MKALRLISSFRVRLMLVLAALLVLTLGTQYILNVRNARNNRRMRELQTQALVAAVALGFESISAKPRLVELRKRKNNPLLNPQTGRVANIIVVDNNWRISDSLDLELLKVNGEYADRYLRELTALPRVVNLNELPAEDRAHFPVTAANQVGAESFAVSVETVDGRYYVIVVLRSFREGQSFVQAARPLIYTLAVLLAATLVAAVLVWRFTRPIKDLSNAARRVAAGDFDFRVPAA
ncbi:MAG TPA: HAMP domain-containing protein, partial [Pyrinomonadaceae bacterium]|nr:HAMP domain-containing protein [Pyrinomonadaceae bacterium]